MKSLFLCVKSIPILKVCLLCFSARGDFIVPNFEEIWPSGKNKNKPSNRPDGGMDYVLEAMKLGIPGERNKDFTTVGKPRVRTREIGIRV